jgi:hypothetical protein
MHLLSASRIFALCVLGLGPFSQAQEVKSPQLGDLVSKRDASERQLGELLLTGGGSTAESAFADEIAALRKQIKELEDQIKVLSSKDNLSKTNHSWFNGFMQNQIALNTRPETESGFFRSRRMRLGYNHIGDSKTLGRMSIEFAAGINQTTAQIRDAFIQYRPNTLKKASGPTWTFGGQNTPIGYEIAYPSWARTWPERSAYNQTYFNGERGRGILYQNGSPTDYWYVGLFNSLTVNDIETLNNTRGVAGNVGPVAGFQRRSGAWSGGISFFDSERPRYNDGPKTLASSDRRFLYADFRNRQGKLDVRGEWMIGEDRVPNAAIADATATTGAHILFDYQTQPNDTIMFRYELFDRNRNVRGDYQQLYGFGFVKDVGQFLRFTIAHEWQFNVPGIPGGDSFQITTIRAQFRF